MNNVVAFPAPKIERYTINYDPVTHAVEIPLVPDDPTGGACVLAVLIDVLIESGTLTADEALQTALQAAGKL